MAMLIRERVENESNRLYETYCTESSQIIKHQEVSQVQMCDAIIITASNPWSHRNHILGVIIFYIMQITKFSFSGFVIRN